MKKILLSLICLATLLSCNQNSVKIRGEIAGLNGKVVVSTILPGTNSPTQIASEDVSDGSINLSTDKLKLPAYVTVDFNGKHSMNILIDTKDQTWLEGKIKFPSEIVAKGSIIKTEYNKIMETINSKYLIELEELNEKIEKLSKKEKLSENGKVALNVFILQRQSKINSKNSYISKLIQNNTQREVTLLLIQNNFEDNVDIKRKLFNSLTITNKESFLYQKIKESL